MRDLVGYNSALVRVNEFGMLVSYIKISYGSVVASNNVVQKSKCPHYATCTKIGSTDNKAEAMHQMVGSIRQRALILVLVISYEAAHFLTFLNCLVLIARQLHRRARKWFEDEKGFHYGRRHGSTRALQKPLNTLPGSKTAELVLRALIAASIVTLSPHDEGAVYESEAVRERYQI